MTPLRYVRSDQDFRQYLRTLLSRHSGAAVLTALIGHEADVPVSRVQGATTADLVAVTGLCTTTVRLALSRARRARLVARIIHGHSRVNGARKGGAEYRYRLTDEGMAFTRNLTAGQP